MRKEIQRAKHQRNVIIKMIKVEVTKTHALIKIHVRYIVSKNEYQVIILF